MFWIKTDGGALVNLAVASDVVIYSFQKGELQDDRVHHVRVCFPGGNEPDYTVLSRHAKKEDAQQAINELHDLMRHGT